MANRFNLDSTANQAHVSLAGRLLVSSPHGQNEQYEKLVLLIVHHDRDGAVGIALNRGFDQNIEGLWEQLSGGKADFRQGVLHFGGPHSGPIVALHNSDKYAEYETSEGVYLAAQIQNLQALVQSSLACSNKTLGTGQGMHVGLSKSPKQPSTTPSADAENNVADGSKTSDVTTSSGNVAEKCAVKIIVGQAEWKPGELDREFATGQWLPLPVSPGIVFAEPTMMWPLAMRAIGNRFVCDLTQAIVPPHASFN